MLSDGSLLFDRIVEALATGSEETPEDLLEDLEDQGVLTKDETEAIEDCAEGGDDDDD